MEDNKTEKPDELQSPSTETEQASEVTTLKPKNTIKRLWIYILAAIVVLAAGYFLLAGLNDGDSDSNLNQESSEDLTSDIIYNLSGIRDVVDYEGYKWVATDAGVARYRDNEVKFYDERHGIAGLGASEFILHDGSLWVETQTGVSKYQKEGDNFKAYFTEFTNGLEKGLNNVNLFLNEISNQISVSSFENFHVYDPSTDTFIEATGPINTSDIIFTKEFGVANVWDGATFNVLYEFPAGGSEWTRAVELKSYTDQDSDLVSAGERVIIFGRSSEYQNCEDHGNIGATFINEYKAGGTLMSIDSLNTRFFNEELSSYLGTEDYDAGSSGTSACEGKDEFIAYNFVEKDGEIDVEVVEGATDDWTKKPVKYPEVLSDLQKILGRDAFYRIIGVDADGGLITLSTDGIVSEENAGSSSISSPSDSRGFDLTLDRLGIVTSNNFSTTNVLGTLENSLGTITQHAICDGQLKYILTTDYNDFSGETGDVRVFEVDADGKLVSVAKLTKQGNSAPGEVICQQDKLYWVNKDGLVSWNRSTKKFKIEKKLVVSQNLKNTGGSLSDENGNLWTISKQSKGAADILKINTADQQVTSLELINPDDKTGSSDYSIIDVSADYLWVRIVSGSEYFIAAYDHKGELKYKAPTDALNGVDGVSISNSKLFIMVAGPFTSISSVQIIDADAQTQEMLGNDLPVQSFPNSFVFNPVSNEVWVENASVIYSISVNP